MFFGRREELKHVEEAYSLANKGGYTLLISGESGIGKTALVEEFLSKKECLKLKGSCSPILTPPLHPFREALKTVTLDNLLTRGDIPKIIMLYAIHNNGILLGEAERVEIGIDTDIFTSMLSAVSMFVKDSFQNIGKGEEYLEELKYGNYNLVIKQGKIITLIAVLEGRCNEFLHEDLKDIVNNIEKNYEETLKTWDGNMESVEGVKKILFSFINSGKYDGGIVRGNVQEWNFENIRLGLKRKAKDNIVCIFIDDIQWADEATLSLMHYLARSREDRILVIGTYRSEEKMEKLRELEDAIVREGIGTILHLKPLDRDSILFLIEEVMNHRIGVDVFNYIYEKTEGVPLHIIELSRLLIEENMIVDINGIYHLKEESMKVPMKIESLVMRRLRNMGDEEREIIEFSSVAGNYISPEITSCAFQKGKFEVLRILRKLSHSGFIVGDGERYRFYHDYVRSVIYNGIEEGLREEMHKIAADCIESSEIDKELKNSMLAEHYFNAGIYEKSLFYGEKAMENAMNDYAYKESIKFGRIVLKSSQMLNNRGKLVETYVKIGRLYYLMGDYENAIKNYENSLKFGVNYEAYLGLGDSYFQTGKYDDAEKFYNKAGEINKEMGEKILSFLGNVYMRTGKFEDAERCFKKFIDWSMKTGNDEDKIRSYKLMGGLFWVRGDNDNAISYFKKALEIAEKMENKKEMADLLHNIGTSLYDVGKIEESLSYILKSLDIRESIGDIGGYPISANLLGLIYWNLGNVEEARKYFNLSLKYSRLLGKKGDEAGALSNMGILNYYEGDYEEGEKDLLKSVEIFKELKKESWLVEPLIYLISLYIDTKRYNMAKQYFSYSSNILKSLKIEDYEIRLEILRCRYSWEVGGKDCWESVRKKIKNDYHLAVFYQHKWKAMKNCEDGKKAIELFRRSGFLGDLMYFKDLNI